MKRIQALSVVLMLAVGPVLIESAHLSLIQASSEKTTAGSDAGQAVAQASVQSDLKSGAAILTGFGVAPERRAKAEFASGLDMLNVAWGISRSQFTLASTFTVNSTADTPDAAPGNGICADSSGNCTLRAAIQEANALAGPDTIQFNIGTGTPTITPTSVLPDITQSVIIDGNSGGATRVELNGASAGALATGLTITCGGSTVRNMVINRFGQNGIILMTNGDNKLEGNFIGTNATGTVDLGNSFRGVSIEGSPNNTIGGTTAGAGNVISGNNQQGIFITGSTATGNQIQGNFIGTDATGTIDLGNASDGVGIINVANNTVGGTTAGSSNIISGNNRNGVIINGIPATGNKVEGNFIGTDVTGTADLGNSIDGVFIGSANNTVGGTTAGSRNVISGNNRSGVFIVDSDTTGNQIQGNFIGTDVTGTAGLGNSGDGVFISNAPNNTVGGTTAGTRNVISSNRHGVFITGSIATGNQIQGNFIGADVTGTADLGNASDGVRIDSAANNTVGGTTASVRNVISGNNDSGVNIIGNTATGNKVEGNFIGADLNGTTDLGNASDGVRIDSAANNTIGGTTAGAGNVISGNNQNGVFISGGTATGNKVEGNFIGTQADGSSPLPNSFHGVFTSVSRNNIIGGTTSGASNTIAFNTFNGVLIGSEIGNRIQTNSIFSNGTLGINLVNNSVNPNDPCDLDTGANNLQNFPMITSAVANGGSTTVSGSLNSNPGTQFTIEFFSNSAPDPSSFGEGQNFLGSITVTTSGAGDVPSCTATFSVNLPVAVPTGFTITATATNNSTNGTSEFSQGRIVLAPSDADITAFTATAYDGEVLVEWQTGLEVDNLGFNLYREMDGQRTLINDRLLAGSALLVGPETTLTAGRYYALYDSFKGSKQAVQYWLEDLDLNGRSTFHGPVAVTRLASSTSNSKEDKGYAPVLSSLGRSDHQQQNLTRPVQAVASISKTTAAQAEFHSALAAHRDLKLSVREEGWHRVSLHQLVEAGLDPQADARFLQLFVEGRELPMSIAADSGPNAFIEFYGMGTDSPYTDKRVYWLVEGSQPGKRIERKEVRGQPVVQQSFTYTVERRDRTIYFSALKNKERENFFGAVVATDPVDQTVIIQHLDKSSTEEAIIEVAMQGVTRLPHQVRLLLNGEAIGEVNFEGQAQGVAKFTIAQSLLKEGSNTVRLIAEGGSTDVSLVDYIRISYSHSYHAADDSLRLALQSNQQVKISGFSNGKIRVIDVTDADSVAELSGTVEASDGSYSITVAATGEGQRRLFAFTEATSRQAVEIIANQPSNLHKKKQKADLLIIAHHSLLAAVEPLKALREAEGLKVIVVDVEDIYDEFSYGQKTPVAIREFLSFTKTNWKKAPRFVLMVGDASLDPRNYLGKGDSDLVPTKLIDTELMETASDDWLADFDSDGLAEMALGRLPACTYEEAVKMISKIVNYGRSPAAESVLLVSDSNDGFDFEAASKTLRGVVPVGLRVEEIGRSGDEAARAKGRLIESLNRGQKLVSYAGHGSVNVWRGNLLTSEEASRLTNGAKLPVFISMTCLNGYFQDAGLDSLAESLMKAEGGGAVAVWASSGMTGPAEQARMGLELFSHIFAGRAVTVGGAVTRAKAVVSDGDIRRTWILFGDPTMKLRR